MRPTDSSQLFDSWPDKYRQWFETPIGSLVKACEQSLILELLQPQAGEAILDAGCGSGIFTQPVIDAGAHVVGMDLSLPMLCSARHALHSEAFTPIVADMRVLPFAGGCFDKCVSITALEFIDDARTAMDELFRVTRPGGTIVVATLNSLSPWAERRKEDAAAHAQSVFRHARFRSPDEMAALAPVGGVLRTAVHFDKTDKPERARLKEQRGAQAGSMRGAFLIGRWIKP